MTNNSIWFIEARDAAKPSTVPRISPCTQSYPAYSVHSTKTEKPCAGMKQGKVQLEAESESW